MSLVTEENLASLNKIIRNHNLKVNLKNSVDAALLISFMSLTGSMIFGRRGIIGGGIIIENLMRVNMNSISIEFCRSPGNLS